ncbi:pyruvate carboxylase subunit B [Gammaproteobacteria bacterium]|jgi:oxaloacetate decarboxylase alpha subunit|nr:pyruvate carboxylase subunit B [Gammaproteobacteria bacterium]|tara:strand:+ start:112 stop:1467 length:1356 start_codon:yes stop_codon:yes gene_type:complete
MESSKKVGVTEVVLRDGIQSLLATRVPLRDLVSILPALDRVGYWSLETWGGATYDACIRYLNEDPWERLRTFQSLLTKTPQQMLIRGQNLVGYKHYSNAVVAKFLERSAENGIEIFRTFDALNDFNNIEFSIKEVKRIGKHAQGTIAYTTSPVHDLNTWLDLARKIEDAGADSLAIKDMAGLLRPFDAFSLVKELKGSLSIPIHMQTHATTGMSAATNMKAIEAGIDNIDTSISSLSMTYGHSATETMLAIFEDQDRHIDLDLDALDEVSIFFKDIREKYSEFEGGLKGVDSTMLVKQVPGGMLSNLESQLKANKQEDKIDLVKDEIPKVRKDFGYPPLVTPASQIIGAQALLNVMSSRRYENLSNESLNLILGRYGKLPGEIDSALLAQAESIGIEEMNLDESELDKMEDELKSLCKDNNLPDISKNLEMLLTYIMFPNIAFAFFKGLDI